MCGNYWLIDRRQINRRKSLWVFFSFLLLVGWKNKWLIEELWNYDENNCEFQLQLKVNKRLLSSGVQTCQERNQDFGNLQMREGALQSKNSANKTKTKFNVSLGTLADELFSNFLFLSNLTWVIFDSSLPWVKICLYFLSKSKKISRTSSNLPRIIYLGLTTCSKRKHVG